jgi:uncharacterized membrane protein
VTGPARPSVRGTVVVLVLATLFCTTIALLRGLLPSPLSFAPIAVVILAVPGLLWWWERRRPTGPAEPDDRSVLRRMGEGGAGAVGPGIILFLPPIVAGDVPSLLLMGLIAGVIMTLLALGPAWVRWLRARSRAA